MIVNVNFTFAVFSVASKTRRTRTAGNGSGVVEAAYAWVASFIATASNWNITVPAHITSIANAAVIVHLIKTRPCLKQGKIYLSVHLLLKPRPNDRNISQHCWAQHVACVWPPHTMCCDMLGVVGSSLKMVKFEPTTPNTSQHVATGWPNARNMLHPTMLRYVALACCDKLAGA